MLHSLPALLNDLERRLIAGEDPLPLLAGIRWPDLIEWPRNRQEALELKSRLSQITLLLNGLKAPLQATLMGLNLGSFYQAKGGFPLPASLSLRLEAHA